MGKEKRLSPRAREIQEVLNKAEPSDWEKAFVAALQEELDKEKEQRNA